MTEKYAEEKTVEDKTQHQNLEGPGLCPSSLAITLFFVDMLNWGNFSWTDIMYRSTFAEMKNIKYEKLSSWRLKPRSALI